jgi:hypothetical protein
MATNPLNPKPASIQPQDISKSIAQGRVSSEASISPLPNRFFQVVPGAEFFNPANTLIQRAQAQTLLRSSTTNTGGNIYGVVRKPWVFATFEDLTTNQPSTTASQGKPTGGSSIIWVTNPKSVSWSANQRASETKNKSGTVLHVWRDRTRGTDYDDPKLTFEFQSGNILPQSADATKVGSGTKRTRVDGSNVLGPSGRPQVPTQPSSGLLNFYQFLKLVDQQKLAKNGQANLIHILYSSYIFPSVVLSGFFDPQAVLSFTDDSNSPFQVTGWRATFTVYQSTPSIYNYESLIGQWQSESNGSLLAGEAGNNGSGVSSTA